MYEEVKTILGMIAKSVFVAYAIAGFLGGLV